MGLSQRSVQRTFGQSLPMVSKWNNTAALVSPHREGGRPVAFAKAKK
jgi:hypothetical protein